MCGCCSARGGLDLGEKAIGADDGGELGAQHLHRDLAIVLQIVREIDGGHSAGAELVLETVAIGQRGDEARRRVFHVGVAAWGEALRDCQKLRFPAAPVHAAR